MTLEQQLFALVEQHDLSSLSLQVLRVDSGRRLVLSASAQGNNKCAFSVSGVTSAEVVGSAIGQLNAIRHPPCEDVATMQPMEGL